MLGGAQQLGKCAPLSLRLQARAQPVLSQPTPLAGIMQQQPVASPAFTFFLQLSSHFCSHPSAAPTPPCHSPCCSQCVQAAQITFEDFFMADLAIPPLKIVGYEGVLGAATMLLLVLPIVQVRTLACVHVPMHLCASCSWAPPPSLLEPALWRETACYCRGSLRGATRPAVHPATYAGSLPCLLHSTSCPACQAGWQRVPSAGTTKLEGHH